MAKPPPSVTMADIERAAREIQGRVVRTPLIEAPMFPGLPNARIYLKLESLQRTHSFKLRGATNRLAHLTADEAARGVIAASAGNHAQGVAMAAKDRGIPATIVMARTASPLKIRSTRELGARVLLHGTDYEEAHEEAVRRAREEGLTFIHPFDDPKIIAGQGTVGLEILDDLPETRTIIAGVGGGGLVSGILVAARARDPSVRVVGVQPEGADTLRRSLEQGRVVVGGRPDTFADGLATRHVGDLTFRLISELKGEVKVVSDRSIARAAFLLLEQAKLLVEGAGAAPLAALLENPELATPGPVVLVVSGGNLDPFLLDRVLFIGLSAEGRLLRLRSTLRDSPGRLSTFLSVAAEANANVRNIVHDRESPELGPGEVFVELEVEVLDAEHGAEVLRAYRDRGWTVEPVVPTRPTGGLGSVGKPSTD